MFLDMPLEEAMSTQRAIRRLKPDPVDDALILHTVEMALKAPTGNNQQGWVFMVVRDRGRVRAIGDLNRSAWRFYSWLGRKLGLVTEKLEGIVKAGDYLAEHFGETPLVVVPCYKGRVPPFPFIANASYFASIFPAVQNFLLAARAANLGAVLTTLPLWNVRRLKKILELPGNVTPCAIIPVGWPIGKYGPVTRRPVEEVVHLDRYGNREFLNRPAITTVMDPM